MTSQRAVSLSPSYPWSILEVTLNGLSAIDLPKLALTSREEAIRFIAGYGFDVGDHRDREEIDRLRRESLSFIRRLLLEGTGLHFPGRVAQTTDPAELLLMASRDGAGFGRWACALLRVMHTIAHCDDDLRLRYFGEIRSAILTRYQRHVTEENGNLYLGAGCERIPLVSFQVKERKDRDSVILKLLHKPSNIAQQIYDRIGVRLVTPTLLDSLLALRYLKDRHVFGFANIQPEQSKNALLNMAGFHQLIGARPNGERHDNWRQRIESALALPAEGRILPETNPANRNLHSLPGYRAIQFTARQRIRVIPKGRLRLRAAHMILDAAAATATTLARRLSKVATTIPMSPELAHLIEDANEAVKALAATERRTVPHGIEDELTFFFPYEVHILDQASDRRNETGASSHAKYKQRQLESARRRVLGDLLERETSRTRAERHNG